MSAQRLPRTFGSCALGSLGEMAGPGRGGSERCMGGGATDGKLLFTLRSVACLYNVVQASPLSNLLSMHPPEHMPRRQL